MQTVTCATPGWGAPIEDDNAGEGHAVGAQPAHHHVTCGECRVVQRVIGAAASIDVAETHAALREAQDAYAAYTQPPAPGRHMKAHPLGELEEATERLRLAELGVRTLSRLR